jgi:glucose-6-phosphate 1-dehydrogenase
MKFNKTEPAIIVIFGITGDLVKRKLFPAIYDLIKAHLLNESTKIVGLTRQNLTTDQILAELTADHQDYDKDSLDFFKDRFDVRTIDVSNTDDYKALKDYLDSAEDTLGLCATKIYYLSVPSQAQSTIIKNLGESGLNGKCKHGEAETRLLIEKPFGHDLDSAKQLITETAEYFEETQIYRIDHYLAKETVQNISNFRFCNAVFESIWNHDHVARIEVSASELIGVEGRGAFYEQTGALRDFIQNHLLQIVSLLTMEEVDTNSSEAIHHAKLEVLNSIVRINSELVTEHAFRGQYETYQDEVKVPDSFTETYAALELSIDNPRWQGVPIVVSTGKYLGKKSTTVKVTFKRQYKEEADLHNALVFRIEPDEGIDLELYVKKPGFDSELASNDMDFSYKRSFPDTSLTEPYSRVLVDAIRGDNSLFTTSQEIIASWKIVNEVLTSWSANGDGLIVYKNNSNGPTDMPDWLKSDYKL